MALDKIKRNLFQVMSLHFLKCAKSFLNSPSVWLWTTRFPNNYEAFPLFLSYSVLFISRDKENEDYNCRLVARLIFVCRGSVAQVTLNL